MKARIKEWWRLWWDETLIIIGVSTVLCGLIYGGWYLFQTTPFPLEQGTVRDHHFQGPYNHVHDGGTTCWGRDKNGVCTFETENPDIDHEHCSDGCYSIDVEGCSNNRRGDTICREEEIVVSAFTYNHCNRNQLWVRDERECRPQ